MRALSDRQDGLANSEADRGDQRSVAVVGAGITGLVAAFELRRRGVNVTLFESSGHAGGAIRTSHVDGFMAEHGPNSIVTSAAVERLLTQLDLHDDVIEANASANRRYVLRDGRLLPFPMTPPSMLGTRLFSLRAKLRVLMEPLVRRSADDSDESIAAFVRRRLGHEVLDYAVDPFMSALFAGDAEMLSMAHAFPRVHALEREYGSLSKGLMAQRRAARTAAVPHDTTNNDNARSNAGSDEKGGAPSEAATGTRLISFVDGMQMLVDALEASLVGTLRLGCPVRLLHREESRWIVDAGQEGAARSHSFDAVVMATPAHMLAAMELPGTMRKLAGPVERVEYPPVTTITLGFHRRDVTHPLDGFGMLIPFVERRTILGVAFNSSLFPDRAPVDHVTLTCFVGGARAPDLARVPAEALLAGVMDELRALLGVRGDPVFTKHCFWPKAIPQYTVGYQAVKSAAESMERSNPGLYLAGNYRNGVSVGDCVASAQSIAQQVEMYLTRAG